MTADSPRHLAFQALKRITQQAAYADIVLDDLLRRSSLTARDRRLATELTYGAVRRQRTLDALIDRFGTKSAAQQPPDLRLILHLGLYQLRYLTQIPARAVVDTTVELAKAHRLGKLAGVVNGLLRQYLRECGSEATTATEISSAPAPAIAPPLATPGLALSPQLTCGLTLPDSAIAQLGLVHSYPDWIVQVWYDQLQDWSAVAALCEVLNQAPQIDLRVNRHRATVSQVLTAFADAGLSVQPHPHVPDALQLGAASGAVQTLPGFAEGWWTVQDAGAQWVSLLLDPQPGETIIDACAAPGGKTTHIAELMADRGIVWACDLYASRLKKVQRSCDRLGLQSIQIQAGNSQALPQFRGIADRVLLDVPCSGLGTLHRHADARWRQTPATVAELATLQRSLLESALTWLKPGGTLVYATCTLHPAENEQLIRGFLVDHPDWAIVPPPQQSLQDLASPEGWVKLWPHQQATDGFFMVRMAAPLPGQSTASAAPDSETRAL